MGDIISAGLLTEGDVFRMTGGAVYQVDRIRMVTIADQRADIQARRCQASYNMATLSFLAGTPVERLEAVGEADVAEIMANLGPGEAVNVIRWGMGFWA